MVDLRNRCFLIHFTVKSLSSKRKLATSLRPNNGNSPKREIARPLFSFKLPQNTEEQFPIASDEIVRQQIIL